ncbi:MAG: hypothetical protein HOP15_10490, partial [Planctomycetes bacterium]|nr:hypothetical protein [Planctomycetota bacterium]
QRGLAVAGVLCAALTLPGLGAPTLTEFRAHLPELPAGIDYEVWRRSLAAAEVALHADPDDGQAEMQRGIALLCLGRAADARASFQRQETLGFQVAKALYNQACAEVKLGRHEDALVSLMRAADAGLDVASYVAEDPDLAELRVHPDFAAAFGP